MKRVFYLLMLGSVLAAVAQNTERIDVTKRMKGNPTVGIVGFTGEPAQRRNLEDFLWRCGWLDMVTGADAKRADVQLNVQGLPAGGLYTSVKAGNQSFTSDRRSSTTGTAAQETVDDILRQLFRVKAFCTQKIYYVVTGRDNMKELYSCYIDGSGQERITFNNAISTEPSWGHKNALVYTMAKNNTLSVVLADMGRKCQRVVSRSPGLNASAGLSHDGTQLALPLSAQNQVDLYIIDLRTNQRIRMTSDKNVESSPCWSPDNSAVCYVSDKLGTPQLYLQDLRPGGKSRRLSVGNNECVSPDWSNVSNKLCYSMKDNSGQRVICVVDMSGKDSEIKVVTKGAGNWEAPSWGPDGRHIVCTRGDASEKSRDLYIVDSWTNVARPISRGAKLSLPAWRPAY